MALKKYFSRKFVYWLAEDTVKSGESGRLIVEELQSIKVPILFMVGKNEKIYSPSKVIERLNRVAPEIETRLIENAGHDLAMAQPDTINNHILSFLGRDVIYGKTFVRISGLENETPLVLMHGVGGNSLQWMSNVESLSKQYKVFAVDNINDNGRSIPCKNMTNADDYVTWLNELFDGLTLNDGINIVSLSYGGWISTQYALRFPNRINKVVLLVYRSK